MGFLRNKLNQTLTIAAAPLRSNEFLFQTDEQNTTMLKIFRGVFAIHVLVGNFKGQE